MRNGDQFPRKQPPQKIIYWTQPHSYLSEEQELTLECEGMPNQFSERQNSVHHTS